MIYFANRIGSSLDDENVDVFKFSEKGFYRWCFPLSFWKIFMENFMLLRLSFLIYLRCLNPTSQILNNFRKKLGKTELLITFDREMSSSWTFYQSFIITIQNYRRFLITYSSKWSAKIEKLLLNTFGAP